MLRIHTIVCTSARCQLVQAPRCQYVNISHYLTQLQYLCKCSRGSGPFGARTLLQPLNAHIARCPKVAD